MASSFPTTRARRLDRFFFLYYCEKRDPNLISSEFVQETCVPVIFAFGYCKKSYPTLSLSLPTARFVHQETIVEVTLFAFGYYEKCFPTLI